MYVAVHHRITDTDNYWSTVKQAAANLPGDLKLHHCLPTADGREAMCVWEGNSVDAVRSFVEEGVGDYSNNEYWEVEQKEGVHLPSRVS